MYTAGVTTDAANSAQARALIDLLTSGEASELRASAGFLLPALALGACGDLEHWHNFEGTRIMVPYVDATEQLVVELLVRDLERSLSFYRALGFDLLGAHERFAALTWEGHRLFLDQQVMHGRQRQ